MADLTTTTLEVRGMRCAGCVNHVERDLKAVPGVADASVNLATESATVRYDAGQVAVGDLIAAVHQAGYEAIAPAEDDDDHAHDHAHGHAHGSTEARWDWRFLVGAVLAVPVFILGMFVMHSNASAWWQLVLATPVQVILGWPFYRGTFHEVRRLRPGMDSLVALGTTVAYIYSLVVTVRGGHAVYFDTAVVILTLIGLGKLMERRARRAAAAAIRGLMDLQPPEAAVIRDGREVTIPVRQVHKGDVVIVRPGQKVPVDGQIIEGRSEIDAAMVTGESLPIEVGPGDSVIGGTLNQGGSFRFTATRTGKRTVLAQMVELVKQAQASKAGIQRIADRVAGVFVPIVLLIALAALLGWGLSRGDWVFAMYTMVAVLIVACPCALGLATPTAIMVGTGLGARQGILIKDAAALERAGKLTHIVLDKTGTVTRGRPGVTDVLPLPALDAPSSDGDGETATEPAMDADRLLHLAASLEQGSEHPLGKAIVEHARERGLELRKVEDFQSLTAAGVRGRVDGHIVIVGRPAALKQQGVGDADRLHEQRQQMQGATRTFVGVAVDGRAVGLIGLADAIRPEAADAIGQLHRLGLKVLLMTGDQEPVARAVAEQVGIDDVFAEVMPQDKQDRVEALQQQFATVAMVGDGINDAPALAAADIGIAMGGGTDIAANAGHVVLMGEDLNLLPRAIRLSRATMKRIHYGLFWAFAYNLLLIPVAAAGLLQPMLAALAMAFSSVSVVGNALYLKWSWKG